MIRVKQPTLLIAITAFLLGSTTTALFSQPQAAYIDERTTNQIYSFTALITSVDQDNSEILVTTLDQFRTGPEKLSLNTVELLITPASTLIAQDFQIEEEVLTSLNEQREISIAELTPEQLVYVTVKDSLRGFEVVKLYLGSPYPVLDKTIPPLLELSQVPALIQVQE